MIDPRIIDQLSGLGKKIEDDLKPFREGMARIHRNAFLPLQTALNEAADSLRAGLEGRTF